jgi:hypothetical protein
MYLASVWLCAPASCFGWALTSTPRRVITLWWSRSTLPNGCVFGLSLREDWLRDELIVVVVRCKRLVDRNASPIATLLVSLSLWQHGTSVLLCTSLTDVSFSVVVARYQFLYCDARRLLQRLLWYRGRCHYIIGRLSVGRNDLIFVDGCRLAM